MRVKLEILWKILSQVKVKVWLPLPIETPNQKIIKVEIPNFKEIKSSNYHYIYTELSSNSIIKTKIFMDLKKILRYKENLEKKFLKKFLKDNKYLKIDKVRYLANKLKTPRNFYDWIIKNIKFPDDLSKHLKNLNFLENTDEILRNKTAECGGKSLLFVALCRAQGIPARLVNGYFLKEGEISLFDAKLNNKSLELHQWAEFFDGNFWIPVDCSLAQEENKDYFGKFNDYRIVISKDMNFKLIDDGFIPFLQVGVIKPKTLNKSHNFNIMIKLKINNDKNEKSKY